METPRAVVDLRSSVELPLTLVKMDYLPASIQSILHGKIVYASLSIK